MYKTAVFLRYRSRASLHRITLTIGLHTSADQIRGVRTGGLGSTTMLRCALFANGRQFVNAKRMPVYGLPWFDNKLHSFGELIYLLMLYSARCPFRLAEAGNKYSGVYFYTV